MTITGRSIVRKPKIVVLDSKMKKDRSTDKAKRKGLKIKSKQKGKRLKSLNGMVFLMGRDLPKKVTFKVSLFVS